MPNGWSLWTTEKTEPHICRINLMIWSTKAIPGIHSECMLDYFCSYGLCPKQVYTSALYTHIYILRLVSNMSPNMWLDK